MGYQVGNVCYVDKSAADDVYYSLVTPLVTDAGISHPIRKPDGWFLNGQQLHSALPECSPLQNFKDGAQIGSGFVLIAITLSMTVIISRLLK